MERGHGAWWSPISPGKPGARGDIPIGLSRPEYREVRGYLERMGARPRYPLLRRDRPCPRLEHAGPGHIRGQGPGTLRSGDEDRHRGRRHGHRSGAVKAGEMVVSLGGTFKGLDTASVVYNIFTDFEVLELIARPLHPGKRQAQTRAERIAGRPRSVLPFYRDPTGKGSICSGDPRGSRRLRQRPTASTGEASSREKNEQGIQRLL